MKKYWIKRGGFCNVYELFWTDSQEMEEKTQVADWAEPISRKEAEHLCAEENARRKQEPNSAGYADNMIFPADYDADIEGSPIGNRKFCKKGYIWEKRGRTK